MSQTPEEMRRAQEEMYLSMLQWRARWEADLSDPFAYERAEAERLAALCRANYGGTTERPDTTIPSTHYSQKPVGFFPRTITEAGRESVRAVYDFCDNLRMVENGDHIGARMLRAKHLTFLLDRAQRAVGERTLDETAKDLSERQREVILSAQKWRAFDHDSGVNVPKVMQGLPDCEDDSHTKDIVRGFIAEGVLSEAGKGRWRVFWLTLRGRALADHLQYVYGLPEITTPR